mgnify:CR=1 FL=1
MSYNLRTGLIGSGDIDINVNLSNLDASNITTGVFSVERIDTTGNPFSLNLIPDNIPDTKLGNISVGKLAGIINSQNIALTSIPDIPTSKITSGVLDAARLPVIGNSLIATDSIASEKVNIASGAFNSALIPDLGTGKITSGTFAELRLPVIGNTLISNDSIESGKIDTTSGAFNLTLIPNMSASKITSGTLNVLRIPNLPPNAIVGLSESGVSGGTTSTLSTAIMPLLSAMPGQCTSSQLPSNIQVTQLVATSTIVCGGDLGVEGELECEGDLQCDGDFSCDGNANLGNSTSDTTTCTGDLSVGGHTILGNSNTDQCLIKGVLTCNANVNLGNATTDQCLIKGNLVTTNGFHLNAAYPILPPGFPSSYGGGAGAATVYTRKLPILPNDFIVNDDTSYFNLSVYDGTGSITSNQFTGGVRTHSTTHEIYTFVSIPYGYRLYSYKIFMRTTAGGIPTGTTTTAHRMSNNNNVRVNLYTSGYPMYNPVTTYVNAENICPLPAVVGGGQGVPSSNGFNADNYMIIGVQVTSTSQVVYGGWVHIEPDV